MCEFGRREPKLRFSSKSDFYKALGLLARAVESHACTIVKENNQEQGAWTEEFRIRITSNPNGVFDTYFSGKVTKGVGSVVGRINNNEYISEISTNNYIPIDHSNIDIPNVKSTVPPEYIGDFEYGYGLI